MFTCLTPVSYTHLDVYKRQVSRRFTEKLKKRDRRLGFTERIIENNAEKVKDYENVSEYLA